MLKRRDLTKIQLDCILAMQARQKLAVWSKPGSGKTVMALTALEDMFPSRVLIVGSKRIIQHVWRQEARLWEHLQHITFEIIQGPPQKRRELLRGTETRYLLINYELLVWLLEELEGDLSDFDAIVFDELSKMGDPGSKRFKKLRKAILKVPYRIGLTGTPRGNSLMRIWAQTWCTSGAVLEKTFTQFKTRYFFPVDDKRVIWVPYADTESNLRKRLQPYAYATPPEAASKEARINTIPVEIPASARKIYETLENDLEVTIGTAEIVAIQPAQRRNKLIQIASGAVYHGHDGEWVAVHDAKITALKDFVEDMQGEQLLVFFRYKHELQRIQEQFKDVATIDQVDAWIAGGHQILAVHPASAAHGLNLHRGGCTTALWMSLPESQELWEQGNRRLARKGQRNEVVSHILFAVNTKEQQVADGLRSHGQLQDLLLEETYESQ